MQSHQPTWKPIRHSARTGFVTAITAPRISPAIGLTQMETTAECSRDKTEAAMKMRWSAGPNRAQARRTNLMRVAARAELWEFARRPHLTQARFLPWSLVLN